MRTIKLPCYNIVVELGDLAGGCISSDLVPEGDQHVVVGSDEDLEELRNLAGLNAIESMILAHACAGIDIESPAYLEGIETAVDAVLNNG